MLIDAKHRVKRHKRSLKRATNSTNVRLDACGATLATIHARYDGVSHLPPSPHARIQSTACINQPARSPVSRRRRACSQKRGRGVSMQAQGQERAQEMRGQRSRVSKPEADCCRHAASPWCKVCLLKKRQACRWSLEARCVARHLGLQSYRQHQTCSACAGLLSE